VLDATASWLLMRRMGARCRRRAPEANGQLRVDPLRPSRSSAVDAEQPEPCAREPARNALRYARKSPKVAIHLARFTPRGPGFLASREIGATIPPDVNPIGVRAVFIDPPQPRHRAGPVYLTRAVGVTARARLPREQMATSSATSSSSNMRPPGADRRRARYPRLTTNASHFSLLVVAPNPTCARCTS